MKVLAALLALFAATPVWAQSSPEPRTADPSTSDAPVAEPELRAELLQRFAAEQDVRARSIPLGGAVPDSLASPSPALTAVLAEMTQIDADNLTFVEALVRERGWPTRALVGADGVSAVWFIFQHATVEVQERVLPLVEAAWRAGDLPGSKYALMLDRVRLVRGEPQVYGSQPNMAADGSVSVPTTVDPENLDARRAEVGLGPIEEYLQAVREAYGIAAAPSE